MPHKMLGKWMVFFSSYLGRCPSCSQQGSPHWMGEAMGEPQKAAAGARLLHLHAARSEAKPLY